MGLIKNLIVVLILTFVVCSCKSCRKDPQPTSKKYEEDPSSTTKDPRERLRGTWTFFDYTFKEKSIKDSLNKLFNNRFNINNVKLSYAWVDEKTWALKLFDGIVGKMTGNFDETNIELTASTLNDTSQIKWFITPFKYQSKQITQQWFVTKLFDDELRIVHRTDSGEFKIFFNRQ